MSYSFKNIWRCKTLWIASCCVLVYLVCAWALPRQPWLETVRIAQATLALVALVALSKEIWRAATKLVPDRVDALTMAMALKEFAFLWTGVWLLLWRLSADGNGDRQDWMLDSASFGLLAGWLPTLSSLLLVTVPGVLRHDPDTGEDIPPVRLIMSGVIAGIGLLAVLVVLATKPDARMLVEIIRSWVP